MVVARSNTGTVARPAPGRIIEPLRGTPARLAAESQGHIWTVLALSTSIGEHAGIGDALMTAHRTGLRRAARMAKAAGAYDLHILLVDLIAMADLMAELDEAEDYHRREIGAEAEDERRSLLAANTIHGLLLGQAEADAPCEILEMAYPLDGTGICGRQRLPMGSIRFEVCDQPAGHEQRGQTYCVFVAIPPTGVGATDGG